MNTVAERIALLLLMVLVIAPLPGLAEAAVADPMGGTGGGPIDGFLQVRVIQDGTGDPIGGAFVMVGPRPGDPFADNWGFASIDGEIEFIDPALQGPVTVTATAEGRRGLSLVAVDAADLVLPLRLLDPAGPTYEIGDYVSGIDVNNGPFNAGDGNLDLAIVLPSLGLADLLSLDLDGLFGPPEIVEILGEEIEVPSNVFIPRQWELFVEISKEHYALFLPEGPHTLTALSARVPVDAVLGGGEISELLPQFQWRETDLLDWDVTGDTDEADLFVDPDLLVTANLTLENVPDGSIAYCISGGDLDGLAGLGRLIPLGITSLDCPAGSGPCSGTLGLTTTDAVGEFAGMTYFPMVACESSSGDQLLVVIDRANRPRDYAIGLGSFFHWLDLSYGQGEFSWNGVENPANGSPEVAVQIARIEDPASGTALWELFLPGDLQAFAPPRLPAEAPGGLLDATEYRCVQISLGLGHEHPFDFDEFAFSEIVAHASHASQDRLRFVYEAEPASIPATGGHEAAFALAARPNPFRESVGVVLRMRERETAAVSVLTVDGRVVATLAGGALDAGTHRLVWSGKDETGRPLPSGLYLIRAQTADRTAGLPVLLLR